MIFKRNSNSLERKRCKITNILKYVDMITSDIPSKQKEKATQIKEVKDTSVYRVKDNITDNAEDNIVKPYNYNSRLNGVLEGLDLLRFEESDASLVKSVVKSTYAALLEFANEIYQSWEHDVIYDISNHPTFNVFDSFRRFHYNYFVLEDMISALKDFNDLIKAFYPSNSLCELPEKEELSFSDTYKLHLFIDYYRGYYGDKYTSSFKEFTKMRIELFGVRTLGSKEDILKDELIEELLSK